MFTSGNKALRTHFLALDLPELPLVKDEKAMNEGVEWQFKIILCFLPNRKCKFFQVDTATIQLIEWH